MLVPRLLPDNDREPLTRADCRASWPMTQIIGGEEMCPRTMKARARSQLATARGGISRLSLAARRAFCER